MSAIPIDRSPDLLQLRQAGYNIIVTDAGFLVVRDVPYVNGQRQIVYGAVASKLELAGDVTVRPQDHTAKFLGEYPCTKDGAPLDILRQNSEPCTLGSGLVSQHSFSRKPQCGYYANYFEKMTTYVSLIMQPALALDPALNAKTRQVIEPEPTASASSTAAGRIQIFITPYDEDPAAFGIARIRRDLPSAPLAHATEFSIAGGRGVSFDDAAGREIWFAAAGQLYQMTAPEALAAEAQSAVDSFQLR